MADPNSTSITGPGGSGVRDPQLAELEAALNRIIDEVYPPGCIRVDAEQLRYFAVQMITTLGEASLRPANRTIAKFVARELYDHSTGPSRSSMHFKALTRICGVFGLRWHNQKVASEDFGPIFRDHGCHSDIELGVEHVLINLIRDSENAGDTSSQ